MKIICYKITYSKKDATISVCGCEALANWANQTYIDFYGKHYAERYDANSAPEEVILDLKLPNNLLDRIEDADNYIKEELEKTTKIKVESFNWRVIG